MMKSYARRILATASVAAVAIGTAGVLNAQPVETRANVPFAFTAGTTVLPRGEYSLATLPGHLDAVMIKSLQHGVILLSQPAGSGRSDNTARLVFERYGDQYFLREIRLPDDVAFELPKSAGERAAAKRFAGGAKPDVVVVALRQ